MARFTFASLEKLLFFLVPLALYWLGNEGMSVWDRDEPRYASVAQTMRETGDYIVPYFNQNFRYQKPVLTYWLVALATSCFGESDFSVRLFSGLLMSATCLLTRRLGNGLLGVPAGVFAGWMLALAPLSMFLGKLCIPDGPQLFFATLMLAGLARACERAADWGPSHGVASGGRGFEVSNEFLLCLGLAGAVLTKGPVAPGMAAAALLVYFLLCRSTPFGRGLRLHVVAPISLALILPWALAILFAAGPGFFVESLGKQVGGRILQSFDGRLHPPGFYVAAIFIVTAPWLPLAILAVVRNRQEIRQPGPTTFLVAWIVGATAMLECFRSKQVHYLAPACPAVYLLAGRCLADLWAGRQVWRRDGHDRRAVGFVALGQLVLLGTIVGLGIVGPLRGSLWPVAAGTVSLAAVAWAITLCRRGSLGLAFAGYSLGSAVAWTLLFAAYLPGVEERRIARTLAHRLAAVTAPGERIWMHAEIEPSLVYYSDRDFLELVNTEQILRETRFQSDPRWVVMSADSMGQLGPRLAGRISIDSTYRGWLKRHDETIHLVRVLPEQSVQTASRDRQQPVD